MRGIQIFSKKSTIFNCLVIVIALVLGFIVGPRVYADESVSLNPVLVYVESNQERYRFDLICADGWSSIKYYWSVDGVEYKHFSNSLDNQLYISSYIGNASYNYIYAVVVYDGIEYRSNIVQAVNLSNSNISERFKFFKFGNDVLDFLISSFNIVLPWCLEHPIVFVGLALSLIIAAIGTVRHIIGGSDEKDSSALLSSD